MTVRIRSRIGEAAVRCGALSVTRRLTKNIPRVLMYHRFAATTGLARRLPVGYFEQQIKLLKTNFRLMTVSELVRCARENGKWPTNVAVITIDDGYLDVYEQAFPVLRKFEVPATVYVTTDFVDGKGWLWPDSIQAALAATEKSRLVVELHGRERQYLLPVDIQKAWSEIADACLEMSDTRKDVFIADLVRALNVERRAVPTIEFAAMNWEQVREMHRAGIEIGAHSKSHPSLAKVEYARRDYEIFGSKMRLEDELGAEVESFAYPHGRPEDMDADTEERVKAAGFSSCAVAFHDGTVVYEPFAIRRHGIGSCPVEFRKVVDGYDVIARRIGAR